MRNRCTTPVTVPDDLFRLVTKETKEYIRPVQYLDAYLWGLRRNGASEEEILNAKRRNTPGDTMNVKTTVFHENILNLHVLGFPKKVKAFKKTKVKLLQS